MHDIPTPEVRLLALAQVAEVLGIDVDEVMNLVHSRRLRGIRVGTPGQWRVEESSVTEYLDEQTEEARRMALWNQANEASFPELWGIGYVRNPD